jgi:hypothetical protein
MNKIGMLAAPVRSNAPGTKYVASSTMLANKAPSVNQQSIATNTGRVGASTTLRTSKQRAAIFAAVVSVPPPPLEVATTEAIQSASGNHIGSLRMTLDFLSFRNTKIGISTAGSDISIVTANVNRLSSICPSKLRFGSFRAAKPSNPYRSVRHLKRCRKPA